MKRLVISYSQIVIFLFVLTTFLGFIAPFSYYHLFKGSVQLFSVLCIIFVFPYLNNIVHSIALKNCAISICILSIYLNFQSFFVSGCLYNYQYFLVLFLVISYLCIPCDIRSEIQNYFIKIFAVLLCVSIIEFIIFKLTNFSLQKTDVVRTESSGSAQYFYHLVLNLIKSDNIITRYQFIFDEPGALGTLCVFLFFLTHNTKYKKEQIIFLVAGILSLSLAFYALFLFSLIYTLRTKFKYAITIVLTVISLYFVFQENIDQRVFTRFENMESRATYSTKQAVLNMFSSNDFLWGYGVQAELPDKYDEGETVGVYREFYKIGFLGVLLTLLQYCLMIISFNKLGFRTVVLILLLVLSYYQRSSIYNLVNFVILYPFPILKKGFH